MKKTSVAAAFVGAVLATVMAPQTAQAQTMPDGSELRGATVRVEMSDGVTNTVNFHPDGTASITSPSGLKTVQGQWFVQNGMLCLEASGRRECWPYQTAFQLNMPVTLTSDCPATSRWTAHTLAQPPQQVVEPERG